MDIGNYISDGFNSKNPKTFEGKPIVKNPDGSWSHEISTTIEVDGQYMNIPTMFGGKKFKPDQAIEILRRNGWRDPDNGKRVLTFKSEAEAQAFGVKVADKYGIKRVFLCHTQAESDEIDPFPFLLRPPIILVSRQKPEVEREIEALVKTMGGQYAGT